MNKLETILTVSNTNFKNEISKEDIQECLPKIKFLSGGYVTARNLYMFLSLEGFKTLKRLVNRGYKVVINDTIKYLVSNSEEGFFGVATSLKNCYDLAEKNKEKRFLFYNISTGEIEHFYKD